MRQTDFITILECLPDKRATKLFRDDPQQKPDDYDAGMFCRAFTAEIAGLDDLAEVLDAVRADPHLFVIAGKLKGDVPVDADGWTEEFLPRRKHDRDDAAAAYEPASHRWLCLDLDKTAAADLAELRAALPEWCRDAEAIWQPSANAHRYDTLRGKLWIWLDRPVGEAEARALCGACGADASVMVATQPIYIADPIFVGCDDPHPSRAPVRVDGSVAAPPKHTAKAARAARASAGGDALDKAIAIAERLPPSVEHHGGEAALFTCARELATVIADADIIEGVLDAVFNPRCLPPWPASKIRYEAERAAEARAKIARVAKALRPKPIAEPGTVPIEANDAGADDSAESDEDSFDPNLEYSHTGKPIASLTNACKMLESWFGGGIWRDLTTGEIRCDGFDGMPAGDWTSSHVTQFRINCEQFQLRLSKATTEEAVEVHADRHARNPVRDELERLAGTWDGVARVDGALTKYWGCADTPAVRAASRVFHLGMAARGLRPGEKVDTVLILCGAQGAQKSTWLEVMAGDARRVNDAPIAVGEREGCIALRGKWLVELTELESVQRKKDVAAVKAFVTTRIDRYRPLYERYTRDVPRTCVFVGTSNEREILRDDTGERRWMPVWVATLDLAGLRRERDQIVAEAAARVLAGEQHWPTAAEKEVLAEHSHEYKETANPWDELVERWIDRKPERAAGVTIAEVTDQSGPIPVPRDQLDGMVKKIAAVLRRLGFERGERKRTGLARAYVWARPGAAARATAADARGAAGAPN